MKWKWACAFTGTTAKGVNNAAISSPDLNHLQSACSSLANPSIKFEHLGIQHGLSQSTVYCILQDRQGFMWFGTQAGVNRYDGYKFTVYQQDVFNSTSLAQNEIVVICEDHTGTLWLASSNRATLNRFEPEQERFTRFAHDPNSHHSLSNGGITALYEDHTGTFWVGTQNGLNKFDRENEQFTRFFHDERDSNSISDNAISFISEDHTGALWIGTAGGGLNRYDPMTRRWTRFVHDPKNSLSLSHPSVRAIFEDRFGTLWVGTFGGGLNRFNRESGHFTSFVHDAKNQHSINGNYVWAICEDSLAPNILWVAADGLNRFDPNTQQFTRFVNDPQNPRSLSSDYVGALCVDRNGTLWVGTMGGGLNRFDHKTGQFIHFTVKDGLPGNFVAGILADDLGRLWLSGNGLSCFDPQAQTFRNFDVTDGLASNEFLMPSQHKSNDGEMFFGSASSGFTVFHPDSIRDNPYIPPVVITAFKRYNTDSTSGIAIQEKGVFARKEISVSYKDKVLSFEFAALSYRSTFNNQYAYKLEGFNNTWTQLGTKREVTFTNLDPGEYTLRVKGSNNDGVWSEEGTSLKIIITPPWWRTRWAYVCYLMLFGVALYGWRRFELNRAKLRNELKMKNFEAQKLQEMDHMKSRFFANISHEFRTPLTLILGPVEQMNSGEFRGNVKEAYDMILRNGRRLLRLINQLLDLARIEAGRMTLQTRQEDIVSFLKGLVLSFASAAERKHIALNIIAEDENLIVYFDRDKLEKIVSNLLSNALKFTPEGGMVSVQLAESSEQLPAKKLPTAHCLLITIKDTGPGISPEQRDKIFDRFYQVDALHTREQEGTGIGLALTKELVELHHGEIIVESEVGRGTTFIVRLPLGKAHLKAEEIASDQLSVVSDQASDKLQVASGRDSDFPSIQQSLTPSIRESTTSDETLILVGEDNRDVRLYIRQYLEPVFKVIEAVDGLDGVEKALEIIPDLIISDVMMPKRDGNELCRILKADEKTSHVPIIMLTAKADRDSKVQGLEIGADDYLIKPFDSKELLARVHNLIKQRRQLRERFSREIVLKPREIAITPMDEVFLNKVKAVVEKYLGEEDFDVEILSREVGMSHSQIHRKLKALTNQSASQFIRSLRLHRAVELLKQKAGTVAEIAYQVGFGSQAYFTKCFHEQFGCSPKDYVRKDT